MALTADEKFTSVMLKLKNIRPFYSAVYSQLPKYELPNDFYMQTMGVTSNSIMYSDEFVMSTPMPEFVYVNLHEIVHFALLHPSRRGNRHHIIFNIACDMYVNKILGEELNLIPGATNIINTVEVKMPSNIIYESWVNTDEDTVESIYDRIRDDYEVIEVGFGTNSDTGSGPRVYKINADGTKEDITDKIKDNVFTSEGQDKNLEDKARKIIVEAQTKVAMAGTDPGLVERQVAKALAPKVNWKKLCKKYLIDETSKESSFRSTDKRMLYQNAIFPGQLGYDKSKLERVKIAIDTSGSISDKDLGIFHEQVNQLLTKFKVGAEVIYWDTVVQSIGTFESKTQFQCVRVTGGGGTNPECVFDYFDSKKCKTKPLFTVIFTDGYINFTCRDNWKRKYKDTIWIIVPGGCKDFRPAFGIVVDFDRY